MILQATQDALVTLCENWCWGKEWLVAIYSTKRELLQSLALCGRVSGNCFSVAGGGLSTTVESLYRLVEHLWFRIKPNIKSSFNVFQLKSALFNVHEMHPLF